MSASLTEIFEYENFFYETYHNENNIIRQDSPELNLVNILCAGDVDGAMSLFQEYQQFGNVKSTVDVPQGRFEGLDEIQDFCSNWLNYAKADSSYAVPVKQTRSGGRSCTELMLHFRYDKYGKEVKFPACVVGDLRGHGQLDEVRMYFFFKWLPDLSPYRHRIFRPSHNAQVELNSVCNVIREYSDALANLHFKGGKGIAVSAASTIRSTERLILHRTKQKFPRPVPVRQAECLLKEEDQQPERSQKKCSGILKVRVFLILR